MPRYRAFISYSHADTRFATWLHRELENFRLPRDIGTKLGLPKNRLGAIFRDVSDLGAASKLTAALSDSLRESESLIVVCSEHSAKSSWVDQEIVEFRRIHGESARVFAVITPHAGSEVPEKIFPPSIVEATPLAADARRTADGRRAALLKIIAGLLGLGLDELVRRDAHRRHTRLLIGALGSGVIAVSMTVLALVAISAREDAQRRLSQSEDLVGFMLGDLRNQLTPIGQVRVLESVGEKALEYFETLDDADLTDAALLRKSRALYQIGDVYLQLGEFGSAQKSFQVSLEQIRRLQSAQPNDNDRLFELAQAEYWAGFAAWNSGEFSIAEQHLTAYFDAAWLLYEREPNNSDWIMETVWASNNLGSLAFSRSFYDDAKGHFENAIERIEILITNDPSPDWLFERSTLYSWLGSTHYHMGELQPAKNAFLKALERESDSKNALDELERAYELGWLSDIQFELGQLRDSRVHAEAAASIATALFGADSESMDFLFARTAHARRIARLDMHDELEIDYSSLYRATKILLDTDSPPLSWRELALGVADIGVRSKAEGSLEWALELLQHDTYRSSNNSSLEHRYLSLSVSVAEQVPDQVARVHEVLPDVRRSYEINNDFELGLPMVRAHALLGDHESYNDLRATLIQAGSKHPDLN